MDFNHLHLYVDNVAHWRDHLVRQWGARWVASVAPSTQSPPTTALLCLGQVPLRLSAPSRPEVDGYLRHHPPGVADVAFWVSDLDQAIQPLIAQGGDLLTPITEAPGGRWCQVQGWGSLRHTLVQSDRPMAWVPEVGAIPPGPSSQDNPLISHIDHGVINVAAGEMAAAVDWYCQRLGFQPQQQFTIDTPWSGLRSQVLAHPQGGALLPINEPTTPNSQIQEFLDWNRGAGVQHIALHTGDIIHTVRRLKTLGVRFLEVPPGYYRALDQRPHPGEMVEDWQHLQILADWDDGTPQAKLLQTFTEPIFPMPTLFFEIIQRQKSWANQRPIMAQGFGERNFQALFEAMEQEQQKRGRAKTLPQGHNP
ncbi:MAG: 4-hydroxyphenylpyruvate dioxygenase [Leptolyngbya sp.]|nr:4-hydroxyphenylpyruvate dioxygenase [Leptolyngbya sp.]